MQSAVNPRPPAFPRVRYRIRCPDFSVIPSSPCELRDLLHLRVELGCLLDQPQQPVERLLRRVELLRRMDDQPLPPREQAGQLARLQDRALAVLAAHAHADLERRPLPVTHPQRVDQHILLPPVELQPGAGRHLDRLPPLRLQLAVGHRPQPRLLLPQRPDEHRPADGYSHARLVLRKTRCRAVARLHDRCSGPEYNHGCPSTCPRSHNSPGPIKSPHRAHRTPPAATNGTNASRRPR